MDNQQAFDIVCVHLFEQGQRAMRNGSCVYRTYSGLKCAVGCLIPDNEYDEEFEGENAEFVSSEVKSLHGVESSLLMNLQRVHDNNDFWISTSEMKNCLKIVAKKFYLNSDVLKDLSFKDR